MCLDGIGRDGPFVACNTQATEDLLAIERLALPVLFHHRRQRVFDALVGRKAPLALVAFSATPSDRAACSEPRIDYAAIELLAKRTLHSATFIRRTPRSPAWRS